MDSKPDVLRFYYGPLRIVKQLDDRLEYGDATPETVIYAWVGPEGCPPPLSPHKVVLIPQLHSVVEMISDTYMLKVRIHGGLTEEAEPVVGAAYIYRRGADLVVGSLYYTNRYTYTATSGLQAGLQVYECVRLLDTTPNISSNEYLLLPLDEGEVVERLTKGVPNLQQVFKSTLRVVPMGFRLSIPTLSDDDLDAVLNELRDDGCNEHGWTRYPRCIRWLSCRSDRSRDSTDIGGGIH